MDRERVEEDLRKAANGSAWIGCAKLRKWLGIGQNKFVDFTQDMEYRVSGNRKVYFIGDVAERILRDVE